VRTRKQATVPPKEKPAWLALSKQLA